jgi:hypothetical protein
MGIFGLDDDWLDVIRNSQREIIMKRTNDSRSNPALLFPARVVTAVALITMAGATAFAQEINFEGLVPLEDAQAQVAYIDPDADFSVFTRVAILDAFVSFRSNWQRDQNRSRRGAQRVTARDMERIKADAARIFNEMFTERLETAGFEIVEFADYDVLLLRPAVIDLDITAPDTRSRGRSTTFASSTGAVTLYIELFDSVSGKIIGRAADRQAARSPGGVSWAGSVRNVAEARRLFGSWADQLITFLNEHYLD